MKTALPSDADIAKEALEILMQHMPASKVARFVSAIRIGQGDYTNEREHLFAGESVENLVKQIEAVQRK
jgi:hypothetical protein